MSNDIFFEHLQPNPTSIQFPPLGDDDVRPYNGLAEDKRFADIALRLHAESDQSVRPRFWRITEHIARVMVWQSNSLSFEARYKDSFCNGVALGTMVCSSSVLEVAEGLTIYCHDGEISLQRLEVLEALSNADMYAWVLAMMEYTEYETEELRELAEAVAGDEYEAETIATAQGAQLAYGLLAREVAVETWHRHNDELWREHDELNHRSPPWDTPDDPNFS